MTATTASAAPATPALDRFLDWAAERRTAASVAGALIAGLSVWALLQPLPAHAGGCAAPTIASVDQISPAALV